MGLKVTNNAFGTLNAGITSSSTTIVLQAGEGARFPTLSAGDYFYATLIDTSNNLEIVKVTARSTDTMTVVRAQDNTTARAYSTNDRFELRPTAALFNELTNAVADGDKGDISVSSSGTVWTIDNNAVTQAKLSSGVAGTGPAFSVYKATDQTLTAAVYTVLQFDSELFDTDSCWDTSTYKFTPNVAGYYYFGFTFSSTSSQTQLLQIRKNTTDYTIHYDFGSSSWANSGVIFLYLNGTTDFVQFIGRTESGSTMSAVGTRAFGFLARKA